MATSLSCRVSAICILLAGHSPSPSITNSLVVIVHTKPAIAILVLKLVAMVTSLRTSKSAMSSSDSLAPKSHPWNQNRAASYHTTESYSPSTAKKWWLPRQCPLAPVDLHLTHDSFGPSDVKCKLSQTSPAGAVAKYCDAHVCVCVFVFVCLSASISPESHARSLRNFLCMLPIAVVQSSSGMVTKSRGRSLI